MNEILKLILILLVSLIASIHSESYENATKLRGDLLTNYERSVRPLNNLTGVLNINTTVALYALLDVDSVRGVVTLVLALTCSWFDEKLKWNPTDYDGIQKIDFFQNEVWKPPMTLSTPVEFTVLIDSKMFVTVSSNGLALAFNGEVLESNCEFNMQFWPFDKQICDVCFVPMGYNPVEVQSNIPEPGIILFKTENSEWIIENTSNFITHRYGMSEPCFRFFLRRKSTFYMLTIIVPIAGMIITSSLVFLLPNESGERISYSITIMLALAVFQTVVADEMPKTSEPTAVICVFLLMGMIVSLLSMVIVILNMRLHHKSDTSRLGSWYTLFVKIMARQGCKGHCRNNRVEDDVNEDNTMAANNAFATEKMGQSRKFIDSKADKNGLVFVEPIDNNVNNDTKFDNVTWKDVSHAVDNMCFIVIAVFTTVGSICCLIYMAVSSTYVEP